jgi:hypothetical protein
MTEKTLISITVTGAIHGESPLNISNLEILGRRQG